MAKSLVIVESPNKVKSISKYLGKNYLVRSSVGHIRDLPTSAVKAPKNKPIDRKLPPEEKERIRAERAKAALVRKMGVDPDHNWAAEYYVLPGKEKVLKDLQEAAEKAETIYLATDLDREGEAIAWHLREVIGGDPDRFKRVTFAEITKSAIQAAFEKPTELNMDRVNAQQGRRFLDRVVGYMVSPLLWEKVARGLSAGRVQSVAVRLVVEREVEIHAFIPEEYWQCFVDLGAAAGPMRAEVVKHQGKTYRPTSQAESDAAMAVLKSAAFTVEDCVAKPSRSNPPKPFITSTLQQASSVRLGYSPKKTMMLAQRLYEGGYITYMRTDAVALSKEAVESCRGYIDKEFGADHLPEEANTYASGDGAQEAHEAIRPTDVRMPPDLLSKVDDDAVKLYDLIRRQFIACQMKPALFDTTTVTIAAADYQCRARGRVLRFPGWMAVLKPAKKEDDHILPEVTVGEQLNLIQLDPSQHFTKPPARFTEASLVRELEKRGVGRPSTYVAIIGTIQERGYVRLDNRRLYAEKLGMIVTDRLLDSFKVFMDYDFTAQLEQQLDEVAQGDADYRHVLNNFYQGFKQRLETARENMRQNKPVLIPEIVDDKSGKPMAVRVARTGVFLASTDEEAPTKERTTMNLVPGSEAVAANDEDRELAELQARRRCHLCGSAMDSWLVDEGRKLHICGNSPDCEGYAVETGTFKIKGYEGPELECDKCGAVMQLKSGRFGKYFGCTACSNTRKLLRNGEPAPPKMDPIPMPELRCSKDEEDHFVLRDGATGLFLAASSYPRLRETRNPKLHEIRPHKSELPEKYHYLLDGPDQDPDGLPVIVRYARKTKELYLGSEGEDGKASKWTSYYQGDTWAEPVKAEKKPAKGKAAQSQAKTKQTAAEQSADPALVAE